VRRHQIAAFACFERDFEQVAGVQSEDGSAVGAQVADTAERLVNPLGLFQIRRVDEVVDFPDAVALLVDRGDFHLQHEAHGRRDGHPGQTARLPVQFVAQSEQARLGRHELFADFGHPGRVREVARGHDGDALAVGPERQMLQIQVAAGGAGVLRVYVQIGQKSHGGGTGLRLAQS